MLSHFLNRILFAVSFTCFLFPQSYTFGQANDSFPNILLVIADDLGVDLTPGYHQGASMPNTPTLDSLRAEGITFENVWSAPVCTPTRAGIMSGKYGIKTGVMGLPGNLDIADSSVFHTLERRSNGQYADAVIGKWHISSNPADLQHPQKHGLDFYTGFITGAVRDYNSWSRTENGMRSNDTSYLTTTLTDESIDWIDAQRQPWFLWLAHASPHSPLHVPPSHLYTTPGTNTDYGKYLAMVESLDYEMGRLIASMPDSVRDNTLVIFAGDNGTPGNIVQDYPRNHAKGSLYQGGIRVPMIVAGKGVSRKAEREAALIHLTDINATVLEVGGIDLPGGIFNSLSFKHLLDNSPGPKRDYMYVDLLKNGLHSWTIRNMEYKLIEDENGNQEMYDLINDSLETTDLLIAGLSNPQQEIKFDLEREALHIRTSWSCRDHIQNGDETGIDCGGSACQPCAPTSIENDFSTEKLSLYPNPSSGEIRLETGSAIIQSVSITDLTGKRVYSKKGIDAPIHHLNIKDFFSCLYIVEVVTNEGVIYAKLLKR